jgi:CDP-diacylglycerol--serine O-phosphatidyltransferase
MVLPVFVSVVFFVALLIGYPWHILSFGSVLYLMSLPLGWKNYRDHERSAAAAAEAAASTDAAPPPPPSPAPAAFAPAVTDTEPEERPARLN